jgi:poly(3-hydroxybutyrate) depolymerase
MDRCSWPVCSARIEHEIEGHSRRVWRTEADDDAIETITIAGMGHGVPIGWPAPSNVAETLAPFISTLVSP